MPNLPSQLKDIAAKLEGEERTAVLSAARLIELDPNRLELLLLIQYAETSHNEDLREIAKKVRYGHLSA